MHIGFTPAQQQLRDELRAYYADLLSDDIISALAAEDGIGPVHRQISRQMGNDGWLAVGWPIEYGGRGLSAIEQFITFDESVASGAPIPMLTINTVGPTIMDHGTQAQKDYFLPKIAAGELAFCIGYSEPDAGTDLASLTTKAIKDGDTYIINGQKTWTSLAKGSDYIWLAARTNFEAPKHKGISLFAIPMDTPGLTIEPLSLLSPHNINHTFFDDCRVPATALIGEENQGWRLITSQLNRERVTLCSSGMVSRRLEECEQWAKTAKRADGSYVIDEPWVRRNLAEVEAGMEFLRLANWKVAWTVATQLDQTSTSTSTSTLTSTSTSTTPDVPDPQVMARFIADSSAVKVFGTEFFIDAYRKLMQIYGQRSYIVEGEPGHLSRLEMMYRSTTILTFGGGTNEMQRDLIAQFGLGYPRADR